MFYKLLCKPACRDGGYTERGGQNGNEFYKG
jgi:hypothetical protein